MTPTIPQKNLNFLQICPKSGPNMTPNGPKWLWNDPKWSKMAQKWPKMAQNYPKWPKNDARIYALFPQFFFDWKGYPANFFAFKMYGWNIEFESVLNLIFISGTQGWTWATRERGRGAGKGGDAEGRRIFKGGLYDEMVKNESFDWLAKSPE